MAQESNTELLDGERTQSAVLVISETGIEPDQAYKAVHLPGADADGWTNIQAFASIILSASCATENADVKVEVRKATGGEVDTLLEETLTAGDPEVDLLGSDEQPASIAGYGEVRVMHKYSSTDGGTLDLVGFLAASPADLFNLAKTASRKDTGTTTDSYQWHILSRPDAAFVLMNGFVKNTGSSGNDLSYQAYASFRHDPDKSNPTGEDWVELFPEVTDLSDAASAILGAVEGTKTHVKHIAIGVKTTSAGNHTDYETELAAS